MIPILLAALVHAIPSPPRTGSPAAASSAAAMSAALLSCEEDAEALSGTPFGRTCPATSQATAELRVGWDEEEDGTFDLDDPEAAWDLAFEDERDGGDEGWTWAEE